MWPSLDQGWPGSAFDRGAGPPDPPSGAPGAARPLPCSAATQASDSAAKMTSSKLAAVLLRLLRRAAGRRRVLRAQLGVEEVVHPRLLALVQLLPAGSALVPGRGGPHCARELPQVIYEWRQEKDRVDLNPP